MSTARIAVGIDLAEPAAIAVEQAMSIARRWGSHGVLLPIGAATSAARRAMEDLRQELVDHGVEVSHAVAEGTADFALADRARELGCGLIVIGTHDRLGASGLVAGSVAERTARFAACPVLIARGDPRAAEGGYRQIVCGSDGAVLADIAIAQALELAAPDARVHVVHAWDTTPVAPALTAGDARGRAAAAAAQLGGEVVSCWRAARPELEIALELAEGAPADAIVERARAWDADLIAVGSHGPRGLRRLALGSVAEAVVRHAPCSVLIARGEHAR